MAFIAPSPRAQSAQGLRSVNVMHPECANIPWAQLPLIHLEDKKIKRKTNLSYTKRFQEVTL